MPDALAGRRRPRPHLTAEDIAQARRDYEQHSPSMTNLRICVAEDCGDWPCRRYRHAEATLILAGELPTIG